jgi:hypothetical protein
MSLKEVPKMVGMWCLLLPIVIFAMYPHLLVASEGYHVVIASNIRGNRIAEKWREMSGSTFKGEAEVLEGEADGIRSWDFFRGTLYWE